MSYTLLSGTSAADANRLTVGEECMARELMTNNAVAQASGVMRLTYFTARKTETSTQVRLYSGTNAAGATPTLCRIGLYEIAASGDGTLVAATVNDVNLFAAVSTPYTRSWAAPFPKTQGKRYGLGALVVTAAATPTFPGVTITISAEAGMAPILGWALTGLADLPASFTAGTGVASGNRVYGVVLP